MQRGIFERDSFFGITKVLRGKPRPWYGEIATGGDLNVKKENGSSPIS